MLSVRSSSRRRRRRSISQIAEDQQQKQGISSDHKVTYSEKTSDVALASHQHRGRRAKSEVNTKRNIFVSEPEPNTHRLSSNTTTSMLKVPFGSPTNRKRSLSEAEVEKNNQSKNGDHNNRQQRTVSEGASTNSKEEKHSKKITWHRRSASTGSPQPQIQIQHDKSENIKTTNLLLKVPGIKKSLPRAKSEDRLHELQADKSGKKFI